MIWMRHLILSWLVLFTVVPTASPASVNIGALSYDTFIAPGGGSPGVDAFDIADLTGAFNLPPDFPSADDVTLANAILTLTASDTSQEVFDLGDIGPGFLLDGGGNPVVQVPCDAMFVSAEFTASLLPTMFGLTDGTIFSADTTMLDVVLLPSAGTTLIVDVDQVVFTVNGTISSPTPEPRVEFLAIIGCLACLIRSGCRTKEFV